MLGICKTSCLYLCHVGIYLGNNWNNNDAFWYLSVRGWGRHRLPREGRSKVSGFLSNLHAWMFRNLNMWTLPLRHIWNRKHNKYVQTSVHFSTRQDWIIASTGWRCTTMLKREGHLPNSKSTSTRRRSHKKQFWANTTGHVWTPLIYVVNELAWAGGDCIGLLSRMMCCSCRSFRYAAGISVILLQEKSSRMRGRSANSASKQSTSKTKLSQTDRFYHSDFNGIIDIERTWLNNGLKIKQTWLFPLYTKNDWPSGSMWRQFLLMLSSRKAWSRPTWAGSAWISLQLTSCRGRQRETTGIT